jgi:hypothetical protein
MKKLLVLTSLGLLSQMAAAQSARLDQKLEIEFISILETIENNYGPLKLKEKTVGLDWEASRAEFMQELKTVKNTSEYFNLIAKVFGSLQDAHVSVSLPSTLSLKYPFQFVYAEDKTLVGATEKGLANCAAGPGDELVSINNRSPEVIRQELSQYLGMGNENSDKAYLTLSMSNLSESRGVPVALYDSPIEIFTFKQASGSVINCMMNIQPQGVSFVDRSFHTTKQNIHLASRWDKDLDNFAEESNISQEELTILKRLNQILEKSHNLINLFSHKTLESNIDFQEANGKKLAMGDKEPFFKLPKNFKRIKPRGLFANYLDSANFYAGTFKRGDKNIGFLRIPSYMPTSPVFMLFSIRYYIEQLEKKSDLLIIDQTNNPGGMVAFSDMIISHLVQEKDDQKHMSFLVKPTQAHVRSFLELKSSLEGSGSKSDDAIDPYLKKIYLPKIEQEFKKVYEAYAAGTELSEPVSFRLTSDYLEDMFSSLLRKPETGKETLLGKVVNTLTYFKGVDLTKKTVYSKPIFMWINALDFSGGDATPAVLQDYGRVTLVGSNTAGAGGSVNEYEQGVLHQFKYSLTTSLMYRPSHSIQFVENYGVSPDIEFEATVQDVRDGYANIFERFLTRIGL